MFIKSYSNLSITKGKIHGHPKDLLSFKAITLLDQDLLVISYSAMATWLYLELINPVDTFCGATLTGYHLDGFDCSHFECTAAEIDWSYEIKGFISSCKPTSNTGEYRIEVQPFCPGKIKTSYTIKPQNQLPIRQGEEVHLVQTFSQLITLNQSNLISSIYSVPVVHFLEKQSLSFQAKIA